MRETALSPQSNYTLALTDAGDAQAISGPVASPMIPQGMTVRLVSTVDCFVAVAEGSAPTPSVATDMFLPAYAPEYLFFDNVDPDTSLYVSGIVASGTGNLYIAVMG